MMALHTLKMLKYLSDGRKHDFEEALRRCARFVPPEKGYRAELSSRRGQPRYLSDADVLEAAGRRGAGLHVSGQRRIMRRAMRQQVRIGKLTLENGRIWRTGWVTVDPDDHDRQPESQSRGVSKKRIRARSGELAPLGYKRCPRCGEMREVNQFNIRHRATGVLNGWCKICIRDYQRQTYAEAKRVRRIKGYSK